MTGQEFLKKMGWDKESEHDKLPDWYGIEGIKFIWRGTQSDPLLEYKGRLLNYYMIEDTFWYDYTHDDEDNEIPEQMAKEDEFEDWMRENKEAVYGMLDEILENEEEENDSSR